ncbi:hypothetical protein CALCODRAFT_492141, partial [Calocera cornea HHB12733]
MLAERSHLSGDSGWRWKSAWAKKRTHARVFRLEFLSKTELSLLVTPTSWLALIRLQGTQAHLDIQQLSDSILHLGVV